MVVEDACRAIDVGGSLDDTRQSLAARAIPCIAVNDIRLMPAREGPLRAAARPNWERRVDRNQSAVQHCRSKIAFREKAPPSLGDRGRAGQANGALIIKSPVMPKRLQRPKPDEARHASHRAFDAAALKRQFPSLIDPRLHYLDSAATAHMPNVVLSALLSFELEARANVHEGQHRLARAATDAYDGARARVARFVHAYSVDEVIFTYGATSAINLLAYSLGRLLQPGDEILLSVLEHHSNLVPWQELAERRGVILRYLPITRDGRLDLDWLETEVSDRCRLVALTHCSNVTGALTDVARVVAAARTVGAKVMLDGAQRAPHGPLDVRSLGVDFYVLSGHKTYGPTGIGVLWGRRELLEALPPFLTGGQMIDEVTLTSASFRRAAAAL